MNQGKYVFAQLIEFLSHNDFIACVIKFTFDTSGNFLRFLFPGFT